MKGFLLRHAWQIGFVFGISSSCFLISKSAPSFFAADNVQLLYRVNVEDRYRQHWEAAERDLAAMRCVYGLECQ